MNHSERKRRGGILFLAAGGVFFATATAMHQVSFYGVGAAFMAIGVAFIAQAKKRRG